MPFLRCLGQFANADSPAIRCADQCFVTFFDAVNGWLEKALESGWTPVLTPSTALIILEAVGRHSGRRHRFPVFGTTVEGHIVVRTFRATRSQWLRNLRIRPETRYWRGGTAHPVRALVFGPDAEAPSTETLPFALRCVAVALLPTLNVGWGFTILAPVVDTPE